MKIPMQESEKNKFSIETSSAEVYFSTAIFVNQLKHVVDGKHEFEKRLVSKPITLFRKFWIIKFQTQGTASTIFNAMVWHKLKAMD